jgi:hypothetical protein
LSLRERAPGQFEVVWKSSKLRLPGAQVRPILPDGCGRTAEAPQASDDGERLQLRWVVDCGTDGLAGRTIAVGDLDVATIDALLRVERLDGSRVETILTARHPSWTSPADPTRAQLLRHFARLGADRALTARDPLLLLFGLLLVVATPRRLLQAAAAFVLAHALTLALIGTGTIVAPVRSVGLAIPAALLWLALELTRGATVARRSAWLVGFLLGALAGAACSVGLADATAAAVDTPLALLAFSAGVVLPQLGALLVALALGVVAARVAVPAAALARYCAAYALGILAVFWCLERLVA